MVVTILDKAKRLEFINGFNESEHLIVKIIERLEKKERESSISANRWFS